MEPTSSSAVAEPPKAAAPKKKVKLKSELDSRQFKPPAKKTVVLPPLSEKPQAIPNQNLGQIQTVESPLSKKYLEELQFNEDPMSIVIAPSPEKFAPKYVECWVQGKGIEVLIGNRWIEFKAVPVGKVVVTKRKYVEVLIRLKRNDVTTRIVSFQDGDSENKRTEVDIAPASVHGVTIRHDPSPKGAEWLNRMVSLY